MEFLINEEIVMAAGFLGAISTSCHSDSGSNVSAIIGDDNRQTTSELAAYIGKINGKANCTAFISGPNEITTAAHCFEDTIDLSQYIFENVNGEKVTLDSVKNVYPASDVIIISAPVGYTFLEREKYAEQNEKQIISFDFDIDQLVLSDEGKLHLTSDGLIFHSFDTTPGSSGTPILQNNRVIGIHIGYLPRANVNLGIAIDQIDSSDISAYHDELESEFKVKLPKMPKVGGTLGDVGEVLKGSKKLDVCGYQINVPVISYAMCQAGSALLPANCTAGAAATGGTSCAANFGAVAASCTVSVATVANMAACCIKGGC